MHLISIIIPVYNVEDYLDQCLDSVSVQTYGNLEIILINDGSTDGSGKKCEEWAAKDARIRYIDKRNEGLGASRNVGLSHAQGEFVAFVDSDDWVAPEYIEKLYRKAQETKADISFCDRYTYSSLDDSLTIIRNQVSCDVLEPQSAKSVIYGVFHNTWSKLFLKSFLVENKLYHPSGYYEDGIVPLWMALSRRMAYIPEPLYYYRLYRPGAITSTVKNLPTMRNHFLLVRDEFEKYGLFTEFRQELQKFFELRMLSHLGFARQILKQPEFEEEDKRRALFESIRNDFIALYAETFGTKAAGRFLAPQPGTCVAFGSYNLRRAGQRYCGGGYDDISRYYCFSSVIGAMSRYSARLNALPVRHPVRFRQQQIMAEFTREFVHKNRSAIETVDCVVLDFLEERFSIGEFDGTYLTLSDAFMEMDNAETVVYTPLKRGAKKTEDLWREKCLNLIELLKTVYHGKPVILIKMKLAEWYGATGKEKLFPNIEEIRQANSLLDGHYRYFHENFPSCVVVDVEDKEYFFCDENFSHGRFPWHLNEPAYLEIGKQIRDAVDSMRE